MHILDRDRQILHEKYPDAMECIEHAEMRQHCYSLARGRLWTCDDEIRLVLQNPSCRVQWFVDFLRKQVPNPTLEDILKSVGL